MLIKSIHRMLSSHCDTENVQQLPSTQLQHWHTPIGDGEEIEEYYVDVFGFLIMIQPRPYYAQPRYL